MRKRDNITKLYPPVKLPEERVERIGLFLVLNSIDDRRILVSLDKVQCIEERRPSELAEGEPGWSRVTTMNDSFSVRESFDKIMAGMKAMPPPPPRPR